MIDRRQFIKNTTILSALSTTVLGAQERPKNSSKAKIRYAFVGLGGFANYVAPRVHASGHSAIKALVSADVDKARTWAEKYNINKQNIYSYEQLPELTEVQEIDAVYIATPVGTHAQLAIDCLNAGKHVLVEKCMAASVAECELMIKAATANNKLLMVAYRARFEPYNQTVIKMAEEQQHGQVKSIAAHKGFQIGDLLGKNDWRIQKDLAGGGALVDVGIYSIQACRYITGEEPIEVSAFSHSTMGDQRFKEVEEQVTFMLRFPNGILATGSASWGYELQNHYQIGTEHASIELDPATSNQNLRLVIKQQQPRLSSEHHLRNIDQIDAQFGHFADCIASNTQPLTSGVEGLKDMRVIEALYKSIKERRIVKL